MSYAEEVKWLSAPWFISPTSFSALSAERLSERSSFDLKRGELPVERFVDLLRFGVERRRCHWVSDIAYQVLTAVAGVKKTKKNKVCCFRATFGDFISVLFESKGSICLETRLTRPTYLSCAADKYTFLTQTKNSFQFGKPGHSFQNCQLKSNVFFSFFLFF